MQWNKYLLKDIADVRDGTHDSPKQVSEGFPLVTSRHIKNGKINFLDTYNISEDDFNKINKRSKVDKYDIILSMIGTIGEICIVTTDKKFAIKNVALLKLHGNKLLSQFIYYYLKSPSARYNLIELTKGTTQEYVSLDDLRHFSLPIPPKSEQKTIVHILSSLDDKIDLLHRQNATLEHMAETLFRQWFIEEAQEEWEECKISDIAFINNKTLGKNYKLNTIKYLETGDITSGYIQKTTSCSLETAPSRAKRIVQHNDIIFSLVRPNQRHYGILKNPPKNLIVSTGFCVLSSKQIDPHFLYLFLTTDEMTEHLHSIAEGSTSAYPSLKPSDIANLNILLPPQKILKNFSQYTRAAWDKITSNCQQIQTLEKLRDTLLPKLLSGEVRVRVDE